MRERKSIPSRSVELGCAGRRYTGETPLQPDPKDLRRHYASLSDEALLDINRDDLTPVAQHCYDEEMASRHLAADGDEAAVAADQETEVESDWLESAACACSFGPQDTADLDQACGILDTADVPYQISPRDQEDSQGQPYQIQDVMVPAPWLLLALSVLDREMFNERQEADWRGHLAELSDEDFATIHIDDLTAGMLDRVERLKRIYADELARRGLQEES